MAERTPLDPACNGSIDCPVVHHVSQRQVSAGRWEISHMKLTPGQNKTLRERCDREWADELARMIRKDPPA